VPQEKDFNRIDEGKIRGVFKEVFISREELENLGEKLAKD